MHMFFNLRTWVQSKSRSRSEHAILVWCWHRASNGRTMLNRWSESKVFMSLCSNGLHSVETQLLSIVKRLFVGLVRPALEYASPVWDGLRCPKRDAVALERIQLAVTRAVLCCSRCDVSKDDLHCLGACNGANRRCQVRCQAGRAHAEDWARR